MNGVFSSPIRFNSLLQQLGNDFTLAPNSNDLKYQIVENDDSFDVEIELPGVRREDVTVMIEQNGRGLRITGDRKYSAGDERTSTSFDQRFILDDTAVDASKVEANLINGLLIVKAPKRHNVEEDVKVIPITEKDVVSTDEMQHSEDEDEEGTGSNDGESERIVTVRDQGEKSRPVD
jgi:HSP20 family protein